jgi:hypothetical protein
MLAYLAAHDEMFGNNNTVSLITVQMPLPPRARAAVKAQTSPTVITRTSRQGATGGQVPQSATSMLEPTVVSKLRSPGED